MSLFSNGNPNEAKRERDWISWSFRTLMSLLLAINIALSGYGLKKLVELGEGQAAQVERDKRQDILVVTILERLGALEHLTDTLRDRQAARIPIFDRLIGQVDDHEKRLQLMERGPR